MDKSRNTKKYNPINQLPTGWEQRAGNAVYVSHLLDYPTFRQHDTIVIQSCTGTGKTTAIAQHMNTEWVMNGETSTILSIVTRTSLADQHCKSFKALGLKSYKDVKVGLCDEDALVICLNSLGKLAALDDDEIKNYTLYIDEVTSPVSYTHLTLPTKA